MSSDYPHRDKRLHQPVGVRILFAQELKTYLTDSSLEKFDFFHPSCVLFTESENLKNVGQFRKARSCSFQEA
jgi:hypothetical protein